MDETRQTSAAPLVRQSRHKSKEKNPHLRGEGADQRFGEFPFALVDGARVNSDDGAGAGFGEPDGPGLREGSPAAAFGFAVVLQVLRGFRHVDHDPVQGHDQPLADPAPRVPGLATGAATRSNTIFIGSSPSLFRA